MITVSTTNLSCGTRLLYGLANLELDIENLILRQMVPWYCYIFSDRDNYENGRNLAKFIRKHKLGKLVALKSINPVHGSDITTWMWNYNGGKPSNYEISRRV